MRDRLLAARVVARNRPFYRPDDRRGFLNVTVPAILPWLVAVLALSAPGLASAQPRALATGADLREVSRTLETLSDRVSPAVVQVFAMGYALPDPAGDDPALLTQQRSTGSGVILDPEGFIVTNAHVVLGAYRIQVQIPQPRSRDARSILNPRPRAVGAQLVAADEETDLAVLKVAERDLPSLALADSDAVRPGQLVLAFGSPLGLDSSVTLGVVSAVARQLEPDDPMIYIQTDASINPGNSGGPLVNTEGEVIGINTLILSQSGGHEGLGFAAPSNIVRNIFDQVRRHGQVRRGQIGVRTQTITPALAEGLRLPRDWGVLLGDVFPGGPADRAGLRPGDIVTSLDGKPMENSRQLQVNLYARAIGDRVRLGVLRGGRALDAEVPVVQRADDPGRFASLVRPDKHRFDRLGILGLDLSPSLADLLPELREPTGVVVAASSRGRLPGWEASLEPGDVIHALNGRPVVSLAALREAVAALKPGDAVVLHVERDGALMYVAGRIQ
jgi:serine protease Do